MTSDKTESASILNIINISATISHHSQMWVCIDNSNTDRLLEFYPPSNNFNEQRCYFCHKDTLKYMRVSRTCRFVITVVGGHTPDKIDKNTILMKPNHNCFHSHFNYLSGSSVEVQVWEGKHDRLLLTALAYTVYRPGYLHKHLV